MKFAVVLWAAAAVALGARGALAVPSPFGGDDTGFCPPGAKTAKCEDTVTKNAAALVNFLLKCNIKASDSQFKNAGAGTFDGAACQVTAAAKYDTKVGALNCPPCLDKNAVRDLTVTLINQNGGVVFCDNTSGTPQDPPNTGFVPIDGVEAKCEDCAAKNAGKLTTAIAKCHIKAADRCFKNKANDEEACEDAAQSKYGEATQKCLGCSSCVDFPAIGALVETLLDGNNGQAYCASPSGAFIN
jgi:hypothetical protein